MKVVTLDGESFTVNYETKNAFGGEPGVLYYEFAERPGELFKADRTMDMTRITLQNAEFDALDNLVRKYAVLTKVAVVDDDYPEVRHYYETALRDFVAAMKANGRFE